MSRLRALGLALLVLPAAACSSGGPAVRPSPSAAPPPESLPLGARRLADIGNVTVVALGAPGFDQLPREQRLLAYWLAEAGRKGDAIAWDQQYRNNLPVARLLRGILSRPQAVSPDVLAKVRQYARELYLHHGMHDPDSERKIAPSFTAGELRAAAAAVQAAGADLGLGNAALDESLRSLQAPLFDPSVDAVRTNKAPDGGQDPLLSSAINEYDGVSMADLAGFRDRYPLNSRVVKQDGRIVEQVYRAGDPALGVPPGLYADRLERVVAALEQAAALTSGSQQESLQQLIAYFRTGEPDRFRKSQRAWLRVASPVDYILGFVESYADPRGQKGLFESFVGYDDPVRSAAVRRLAANAQYFEDQKPWPDAYKNKAMRAPAASALVVSGGAGDNRPQSFGGVNLPNEQAERETYGAKSFMLPAQADVLAALRNGRLVREFSPPGMADDLERCLSEQWLAVVSFHEIVGHASGLVSEKLRAAHQDPADVLRENYHTLEEARADLIAHWHAADPKTREIGLIRDARCQELYPQFTTTAWFTYVASIPKGDRVVEDHQRGDQLMIWWFLEHQAIAERKQDGKTYLVVTDPALWRRTAGELLTLLMTIKAEGQADRLAELVQAHAIRIDTAWRDEVIARIGALGLPRKVQPLAPIIRPVLANGKVVDARAETIADLDAQILIDWAEY